MDENKAIEANAGAIAPQEEVKVTLPTEEDLEARKQALEAERARLIEENANYKMAYLKEKSKKKESFGFDEEDPEEKMKRLVREGIAESRLSEINKEREQLLNRALRENKELKLAHLNKTTTTPAAAMGTHSESQTVRDTLVTPDQEKSFRDRGWSDKDIERYKKNLGKYKVQ